jgi:hypothetical protein
MQLIREAIMQRPIASSADATTTGRAAQLIDAIKLETSWQLLSTPARGFRVSEEGHAEEQHALIALWPDMRHRRVPTAFLISFYDFVSDQASRLAFLIEVRRQREANRRPRQ